MPVAAAAVSCVASRRHAIIAAVEAYNRTHSPLPRPAARLLATMFADQNVCCLSQQALAAQGSGNSLRHVLRALIEAGFISRQAGSARVPDTYRLQHRLGDAP